MDEAIRQAILSVSAASPFNRQHGFEIAELSPGHATLKMIADDAAFNHAQVLHAGAVAGLLDTAVGFAAATVAGQVVTVGLNISYFAPSTGRTFEARADVIRAGRTQVFVEAKLVAIGDDDKLIATANAILTRR